MKIGLIDFELFDLKVDIAFFFQSDKSIIYVSITYILIKFLFRDIQTDTDRHTDIQSVITGHQPMYI